MTESPGVPLPLAVLHGTMGSACAATGEVSALAIQAMLEVSKDAETDSPQTKRTDAMLRQVQPACSPIRHADTAACLLYRLPSAGADNCLYNMAALWVCQVVSTLQAFLQDAANIEARRLTCLHDSDTRRKKILGRKKRYSAEKQKWHLDFERLF